MAAESGQRYQEQARHGRVPQAIIPEHRRAASAPACWVVGAVAAEAGPECMVVNSPIANASAAAIMSRTFRAFTGPPAGGGTGLWIE